MEDQWLRVLFLSAALILPLSALRAKGVSLPRWFSMAIIWATIFAVAALVFKAANA